MITLGLEGSELNRDTSRFFFPALLPFLSDSFRREAALDVSIFSSENRGIILCLFPSLAGGFTTMSYH